MCHKILALSKVSETANDLGRLPLRTRTVAETALQEDADAVGLSVLSGAHLTLFPRVVEELHKRGLDDVVVFGGGIIPDADIVTLKAKGVAEIFTPGASMASITEWLENALEAAS